MDLLGAYASDADDSGEERQEQAEQPVGAPRSAAAALQQNSKAGFLSTLPPAGPAAKKPVMFRVPLDPSALADSDEDDDRPAKKVKVDKAKGLMDMLPAPKHSAPAARHDSFARAQASKQKVAVSKPSVTAAPAAGVLGNEAFRVPSAPYQAPSYPAAASIQHPIAHAASASTAHDGKLHVSHAASYAYDNSAEGQAHTHWQQEQAAGPAQPNWGEPSTSHAGPVLDPMEQAYAAENVRGAGGSGRDDPFANAGINFVEVKGQDLRDGSRAARDAQQGMRSALGPDYEARLRREAGPDPDKKSRRKHQITSLFHAAKMKELEQFEQRAQGMKTKAETQAKYGW